MTTKCKHCARCKSGCDYCACCGKCQRCGLEALPTVNPGPVYVPYVPYPSPYTAPPIVWPPPLGPDIWYTTCGETTLNPGPIVQRNYDVGCAAPPQFDMVWTGMSGSPSFASH